MDLRTPEDHLQCKGLGDPVVVASRVHRDRVRRLPMDLPMDLPVGLPTDRRVNPVTRGDGAILLRVASGHSINGGAVHPLHGKVMVLPCINLPATAVQACTAELTLRHDLAKGDQGLHQI
jgi:hypothetical protein